MLGVLTPLPFEHSLGDSSDSGVVTTLDVLEHLREALIVILHLGWPLHVVSVGVVSAGRQRDSLQAG